MKNNRRNPGEAALGGVTSSVRTAAPTPSATIPAASTGWSAASSAPRTARRIPLISRASGGGAGVPGKAYRSIKKPKVYEALRREGMTKTRAAKISNAQAKKKRKKRKS
jgi:hypothetical protein